MRLQKYNLNASNLCAAPMISLAILLSACTVGEDYKKPDLELPQAWSGLKDHNGTHITTAEIMPEKREWWHMFNDQILNDLITRAMAENNDMHIARARVAEAYANEDATDAELWPEINGVGSITRERLNDINGRKPSTFKQAGLSGTWDLDLFGRNKRRIEAATANLEAVMSTSEDVRITIINEVARNYVIYRNYQQQYEITSRNIESQRSTLNMANEQRNAGTVTDLDVSRAEAQVRTSLARLPQINTALFATLTRIMTLTNQSYEQVYNQLQAIAPVPEVPVQEIVALPMSSIRQRPDVITAERRLAEATALNAAAFAEYFPNLSLEAFIGVSESSIYGSASPWTATASALLPILNFGRIESGVDVADARKMQAYYNYRQTVLQAIEETENSFNSYLNELKRRDELDLAAAAQGRAANIAKEQYNAGVATQLDLLTTQRSQLDAESDAISSRALAAEKLMAIYKALGR